MSLRLATELAGAFARNLGDAAQKADSAAVAMDKAATSAQKAAGAPFGGTVYGVGGPDGGTFSDPTFNPHAVTGGVGGGGGSGRSRVRGVGEAVSPPGRVGSGGGGGGRGVVGIGGGSTQDGQLRGAAPSGVQQGLPIASSDGKAIVALLSLQNKLLARIADGADRGAGIPRDAMERMRR